MATWQEGVTHPTTPFPQCCDSLPLSIFAKFMCMMVTVMLAFTMLYLYVVVVSGNRRLSVHCIMCSRLVSMITKVPVL